MTHPVRAPWFLAARSKGLAVAACAALLLSACGGGGGDSGNTNLYNLDAAITRALVNGVRVDGLTGSLAGVTFTLSIQYAPLPDAVFEGVTRKAARQTLVIAGGGSAQTISGVTYFSTSPYAEAGAASDDGSIEVAVPSGTLPTAARTATSGPLSRSTGYTDATKTTIASTTVATWSLDADGDANALACLNAAVTQTGGAAPINGRQCFRIDTAGNVLGAVVTLSSGGMTIEFR